MQEVCPECFDEPYDKINNIEYSKPDVVKESKLEKAEAHKDFLVLMPVRTLCVSGVRMMPKGAYDIEANIGETLTPNALQGNIGVLCTLAG